MAQMSKDEARGLGVTDDEMGDAFKEAVAGDKELQNAPTGDKMPDDSADVVKPSRPASGEASKLMQEAIEEEQRSKAEYEKDWKNTADAKPMDGDKPAFSSFKEAFAWHRKNKPGEDFEFEGKWYTTDLAPEKPRAKPAQKAELAPAEKPAEKRAGLYDTSRDPLVQKAKALFSGSKPTAEASAEKPAEKRPGLYDTSRDPLLQRVKSVVTDSGKSKPLSMEGVDPKTMLPRKG